MVCLVCGKSTNEFQKFGEDQPICKKCDDFFEFDDDDF